MLLLALAWAAPAFAQNNQRGIFDTTPPGSLTPGFTPAAPGHVVIDNGGSASLGGSSATVSYAAPSNSSVATGGTAVVACAAGTIHTGFDLKNPAGATEQLYFNLNGSATTTEGGSNFGLPAGNAYHGPYGTAQALSVNAATSGHAFTATCY